MIVGVPTEMWLSSHRPAASVGRTQPWLTAGPMLPVSGVDWIAIRSQPLQPRIACGECAESARMQQPYRPLGLFVDSLSVTAKRPVGVGASGLPTATVYCWRTFPPSVTVSRRLDTDTFNCQRTAPATQPGRPSSDWVGPAVLERLAHRPAGQHVVW
jgi:hypothetical protein